nr:MAG TPA: DsbA-like protein [Caudoviricetes sp.]
MFFIIEHWCVHCYVQRVHQKYHVKSNFIVKSV